jgi:hypothetical protein
MDYENLRARALEGAGPPRMSVHRAHPTAHFPQAARAEIDQTKIEHAAVFGAYAQLHSRRHGGALVLTSVETGRGKSTVRWLMYLKKDCRVRF